MSLAMYASEYNSEETPKNINKKSTKNKTLKRRDSSKNNPKIDALMKKIHEDEMDDDDDSFSPLDPPISVASERIDNPMETNMEKIIESQKMKHPSQESGNYSVAANAEAFTQLPSQYAKNYYKQFIPYYNQSSENPNPSFEDMNKDELTDKLNQIIYMLEEQQNEKTENVTEELILYSFLGVFIIFVVDSFARAGKYVR
jgi:hypothetical protein